MLHSESSLVRSQYFPQYLLAPKHHNPIHQLLTAGSNSSLKARARVRCWVEFQPTSLSEGWVENEHLGELFVGGLLSTVGSTGLKLEDWHMGNHYSDVILGAMASQNTSPTIVYSTVYSGAVQRKHQSSASLAFVWGIHRVTGEFPAQRASNAENVSIWWRHHVSTFGSTGL